MPRQLKLNQLPLYGRVLLYLLAGVYAIYLAGLGTFLYTTASTSSQPILEHAVNASPSAVIQFWTAANMQSATDIDEQIGTTFTPTQASSDIIAGKAAKQQGQPPRSGEASYPLSTVGKIFFSNEADQDFVCSGTAVVSSNHSVVDTAGHCLYWNGGWMKNVIFCPLYDNGNTPYGCWAARDLEVPADWINAKPNNFHHDMGMAIVAPNDQGDLTDMVGGAGWAYNQSLTQTFDAYGYPAGYPFDGQTRQSCLGGLSKSWQFGGGTVISIPCDMTGGSSGGPWFMSSNNSLYLDGHNDFISSLQRNHMFSPYYDDTWYALYSKAQNS